MSALIEVILPVFLVIGFGYVAVLRGYFSEAAIDGLMRFSQNFAIPLLLFRAISTLDLSQGYDLGLLTSYYTGSLVGFLAGMLGARFLFHRPWTDSVAIGFSALFANSVLLGLPITELAFGADALGPNYAIVSVHAPFCYLLGITTMEVIRNRGGGITQAARAVALAVFRNTLMLAIGLGFIVNLTGWTLPGSVASALDLVIRAALPTALFALGGILRRYRPEGDLTVVLWVCAISLFLHPAIALLLSQQVFGLGQAMVQSAVLTAAMAPGVNSYIFASLYNSAKRVAATAVLAGTLLSVLSVTFWLWVLGA
jgi:predicted permease